MDIRHELGLDQPFYEQYWDWLKGSRPRRLRDVYPDAPAGHDRAAAPVP